VILAERLLPCLSKAAFAPAANGSSPPEVSIDANGPEQTLVRIASNGRSQPKAGLETCRIACHRAFVYPPNIGSIAFSRMHAKVQLIPYIL
jgi:hypothetical protein